METQQLQLEEEEEEGVVVVIVRNRLQGDLTIELDPPRNHRLFHFTLPHNPSFPSSKNVASHDQQQQQDLLFFGSLDSLPPQHNHVRSPPKNPSLISPPVAVKGGHIVRSTGRKDRHTKVCTAKGSRDRRVRLSAPTAIQFYDVQDRLGYDRPSKAVDWLIKKAKAAIDELDHLPSWKPAATAVASSAAAATNTAATAQQETMIGFHQTAALDPGEDDNGLGNMLRQHRQMDEIDKQNNDPTACLSFLPSSLDSDTIADTIKSFPMVVSSDQSVATSSSIQFLGYSPDLIMRTSRQSQDLRLSLQSFQEQPLMLQPCHPQAHKHSQHQQVVLTGTPPPHHSQLVLDGSSSSSSATSMWLSDHQRISQWNSSGGEAGISTAGGSVGLMFGSLAVTPMPMPTPFGQQGQFFQQRGPLQSSNMASVRAWIDPTMAIVTNDHHQVMPIGFAMGGGYSGYSDMLAQIRGQGEEMQDGILDRPSSGFSFSPLSNDIKENLELSSFPDVHVV